MNPERRAFIKVAALAGTATVISGVPLATYVTAPALRDGLGRWVNFGAVGDLKPGSMKMLSYEFMARDGWLVLPQKGFVWAKTKADGALTIFSSSCTHLSCAVGWREDTGVFECPCHSGRFDANGQPLAGPPVKPLAVLEHKIEDGRLLVFLPV
jgi:Rieske Fe-S protein